MKKTILFPAVIALLFCFACNKKDKVMTKTEILTSGTWKLTALVEDNDGNGSFETDIYASFPACQKDDFITFKNNAKVDTDEGPTKCSPSDPQTETSNWQFTSNETSIIIDSETFSIEELNNSTFQIKQVIPGVYGGMVTLTKR